MEAMPALARLNQVAGSDVAAGRAMVALAQMEVVVVGAAAADAAAVVAGAVADESVHCRSACPVCSHHDGRGLPNHQPTTIMPRKATTMSNLSQPLERPVPIMDEKIIFEGSLDCRRKARIRTGIALVPLAGSAALWTFSSIPELKGIIIGLAFFLMVPALCLPHARVSYLDLVERKVVSIQFYAWWQISKCDRPFTEFRGIVLRHLCHPRSEGGDTFSGSVGLKPIADGKILWVKQFEATPDELPTESHHYAAKLSSLTGIPYPSLFEGSELKVV